MESALIRHCPWRTGDRGCADSDDLWAHIAYHQADGPSGPLITGYLSLAGDKGGKEWAIRLASSSFGCVMSWKGVAFRPSDEVGSLPLARGKPRGAGNPTPAHEFARCIRHVREAGEATPADKFNCPNLPPDSRGHELLTRLRESLESEGRTAAKWTGPKWDKGKMMNVLFRAVSVLLRENANLEAQLRTASEHAAALALRGGPPPPPQDGARQEQPLRRRYPSLEALAEGTSRPDRPPATAPPPPYAEDAPAAPAPAAGAPAGGGGAASANSRGPRTRAEMAGLREETGIRPGETPVVWLGRLVVEAGYETLDAGEAVQLARSAAWSRGIVTGSDAVLQNRHWPIPLPALAVEALFQKPHVWHKGRNDDDTSSAETLLFAVVGCSYAMWYPGTSPMGLAQAHQNGRWPHRFLFSPGVVPCTAEAIESATELYGGPQGLLSKLLLNLNIGQPVLSVLSHQGQLQATMGQGPGKRAQVQVATSTYLPQKGGGVGARYPRRQPPQRSAEERAMFGFLLNHSKLSKAQLRMLGDEGQCHLAECFGFKWTSDHQQKKLSAADDLRPYSRLAVADIITDLPYRHLEQIQ